MIKPPPVSTQDLDEVITSLTAEIEGLDDLLAREGSDRKGRYDGSMPPLSDSLRSTFAERKARLERGRTWLQAKIESVIKRREESSSATV